MENQIVCPNCKKSITDKSIIEDALRGVGSDTQSINCECGERITYWNVTAQLRKQKTAGRRFQNWLRGLTHSQG